MLETDLQQALFTAAVVTYSRASNSGKRQNYRVTESMVLEVGGDQALALHKYLKSLRDKHIAHSINPFEKVDFGVIIGPDRAVVGTLVTHIAITGWEVNDLRRFQAHVDALRKRVDAELDELQDTALAAARSTSIDEMEGQPRLNFVPHPPEDVDQPRTDDD
jgi:hypothetical protein